LIVTDVEASASGYIIAFTLQALTDEQRSTLALNGAPVSYFTVDMLQNIEVGGSLTAQECLSPLNVSVFPLPCHCFQQPLRCRLTWDCAWTDQCIVLRPHHAVSC
jgi:hypothetical protein